MTHVLLSNHGGSIRVQAPPMRSVSLLDSAQYACGDRDSQLHLQIVALMKRLQYQLEGKTRWLEMLRSDAVNHSLPTQTIICQEGHQCANAHK